jgi:diaminopimelate decarboxylase
MKNKIKNSLLPPETWGLNENHLGELTIGGCSTVKIARHYGTPLHVVDENRLGKTARDLRQVFKSIYPGKVSVNYAFKCNSIPGVAEKVKQSGLKAEVMSSFELSLARRLGFQGEDIVVNGPCKTEPFLFQCLKNDVRFIVVDSIEEFEVLFRISHSMEKSMKILLRINPNFVPRGMNQGAATGSRKGCAFGLDLRGDEVYRLLNKLHEDPLLKFKGFHFHIGTGIRHPGDYHRALLQIKPLIQKIQKEGLRIEVFDVGGGFAAQTTRELTTCEMILYQSCERLPSSVKLESQVTFQGFANAVSKGMRALFADCELPELIVEPGRCIASSSQILLLTVHRIKDRPKIRKWLITDGGLGTVSMPTYYEYHEMFLCNDINRPRTEKVTIIGPVCFAGDVVYKNKLMPEVNTGEVLAIMDSGAYFNSWESSFGFPRSAVVAVSDGKHRLLRHRETFSEMTCRDYFSTCNRKMDTDQCKN